jgi:hypothetical protein
MVMSWTVSYTSMGRKGYKKLPAQVQAVMKLLIRELETSGPVQTGWPHYGKITGGGLCHHCHLLRGKPTYVAVWRETRENEIEVVYAGTHENASYQRVCKS